MVIATYDSTGDLNYHVSTYFFIEVRDCFVGEIKDELSNTCFACKFGYYSLNTADKECTPCSIGAECDGGSNVAPQAGYWKSSNISNLIIQCEGNTERCNGKFEKSMR